MRTFDELTNQERMVLALVAQGKRNAAIAHELAISIRTVETHLYRIFDKLGVSSRTEAALQVLHREGALTPDVSGISDDRGSESRYSGMQGREKLISRRIETRTIDEREVNEHQY